MYCIAQTLALEKTRMDLEVDCQLAQGLYINTAVGSKFMFVKKSTHQSKKNEKFRTKYFSSQAQQIALKHNEFRSDYRTQ